MIKIFSLGVSLLKKNKQDKHEKTRSENDVKSLKKKM